MSSTLSRWLSVFGGALLTGVLGLFLFGPNGLLAGLLGGLFVLLSALTVYVECEARIEALEDRVNDLESDLKGAGDD